MQNAAIFGCSGLTLTGEERAFFHDVRPWGFILFKRNIDSPAQVRALTDELRAVSGRENVPILIDQEGGRVARLQPPHWRKYPPGRAYGTLAGNDPLVRREVTRLGACPAPAPTTSSATAPMATASPRWPSWDALPPRA
jgi:beta-N-acetylhexosaminidase